MLFTIIKGPINNVYNSASNGLILTETISYVRQIGSQNWKFLDNSTHPHALHTL